MNNAATVMPPHSVRRLERVDDAQLAALADVLVDCVAGGASVGFMQPFGAAQALAFWRRVAEGVERGERALLVGEDAHGIVGTVQLMLDQMPNQPHRADLAKMLVHRRGRRQGWGAALMGAAERVARDAGKTLLVLDTANDEAARLYARLGWREVGMIPNYALYPDGAPCASTYFYRELTPR